MLVKIRRKGLTSDAFLGSFGITPALMGPGCGCERHGKWRSAHRGRPGKSDGMGVFAQEENAIVRLMPHVCQGLLGLGGS